MFEEEDIMKKHVGSISGGAYFNGATCKRNDS